MAFGQSLRRWPAFPDTVDALKYLKQHYRLYVLSNVDNESFSYTSRTLEAQFDGLMTAEDIGSYKPSARNFEYLIDRLASHGIRKDQILHTAQSLFHDHPGTNKIGLASCWINRSTANPALRARPTSCQISISSSIAWVNSRTRTARRGRAERRCGLGVPRLGRLPRRSASEPGRLRQAARGGTRGGARVRKVSMLAIFSPPSMRSIG